MPEIDGETIGLIMSKIDEAKEHGVANFRGSLIVNLAILTLLIDAKITTTEESIQRIEQIQNGLPDMFRDENVSLRVSRAIEILRVFAPHLGDE